MGEHHCHAIGCGTRCKPELLMCPRHWRMVGTRNRIAVLRAYRRGQCDDKRPTRAWMDAANAAIREVAEQTGHVEQYERQRQAVADCVAEITSRLDAAEQGKGEG